MKYDGFRYKVSAYILFTIEELEALMWMSEKHYDRTCRSLSEKGGRIEQMLGIQMLDKNLDIETVPHDLTFRDIDLMCKILEPYWYPDEPKIIYDIRGNLIALINTLSAEQLRLNKVAEEACHTHQTTSS